MVERTGVPFDTVIDYTPLPLHWECGGLSFIALQTGTALARLVQTPNMLGLFAWLFKDQLLARVTAEIKQAARDGEALDEPKRATQEATLLDQMMDCERAECSLIWNAESRGEILDFRRDTTAAALLGVRSVVVAPRAAPSGTSPEHVYLTGSPRR